MSPSTTTDVSAPTTVISFGTYFTARTLAVYASRSRSPVYFLTIAQDSLPAWRSPSSPVGFSPRVAYRSFWLLPPSSSARLVLAHCGSNIVTSLHNLALRHRSSSEPFRASPPVDPGVGYAAPRAPWRPVTGAVLVDVAA